MDPQRKLNFDQPYPSRPKYWFAHALRVMSHCAVAGDVGLLGYAILIEIALTEDAEPALPQKLMQALKAWTGERWMVAVSSEAAGATAHEARRKNEASLFDEARADPLVQKVLQRFPGAEIVGVRERGIQTEASEPDRADDIPGGETEGED